MENWGLIVGRTSVLLLDPERADLVGKKRVLSVQSHEIAHMWFGNVVTMEWWDYLYLNEGGLPYSFSRVSTNKQFSFRYLGELTLQNTWYEKLNSSLERWARSLFQVRQTCNRSS